MEVFVLENQYFAIFYYLLLSLFGDILCYKIIEKHICGVMCYFPKLNCLEGTLLTVNTWYFLETTKSLQICYRLEFLFD